MSIVWMIPLLLTTAAYEVKAVQYSGVVTLTDGVHRYPICADGWDNADAQVACRGFHFRTGEAYSHYADNNHRGYFVYSKFHCTGHESSLAECPRIYLHGNITCKSGHHAGALCYNDDTMAYRLVGDDRTSGRVQLRINREWGSLCWDDVWDDYAAHVFCKSSGFKNGVITAVPEELPALPGPMWSPHFKCNGTESELNRCPHQGWKPIDKSMCHREAAAFCYDNVQLTGGEMKPDMHVGALQMIHQVQWATVCDANFTEVEASVVCWEINPDLPYAKVIKGSAFDDLGELPIITSVACSGMENSITECTTSSEGHCPKGHYVSVNCSKTPFHDDNGKEDKAVQYSHAMTYNNQPICADGWDNADAQVACREYHFRNGEAYSHYADNNHRGYFVYSKFQCTGNESSLAECHHIYIHGNNDCKSGHHAGALCYNDDTMAYRLVGDDRTSGRVQLRINGHWGSLCWDDGWDDYAAHVFCKSSGFKNGVITAVPEELPALPGPMWSPHFKCNGRESELNRCPHKGWIPIDKSTCHREAAAFCYDNVKLTGGEMKPGMHVGALQMISQVQWVTVCDANFTEVEASVVCWEINPDLPYAKVIKGSAFDDLGELPIITSVVCSGMENSITECFTSSEGHCPKGHYVSVNCSKTPFHDDKAKEDEALQYSHAMTFNNRPICADSWDDADAQVACREYHFKTGEAYSHYADNYHREYFVFSKFQCTGQESSLAECPHTYLYSSRDCKSGHHAGVLCYNDDIMAYRLVGDDRTSGRVQLRINGHWGSLCWDDGWDDYAAHVFCKSSGFKNGVVTAVPEELPALPSPMWSPHFKCNGRESELNRCPHKRWAPIDKSTCHREAAAFCYDNVKLTGGEMKPDMHVGALQMIHQGQWATVCDTSFTEVEASVACWEIDPDLPYAKVIKGSAFDDLGELPIITSVVCSGMENSITECTTSSEGHCPKGHYVSLNCSKTPFYEDKAKVKLLGGEDNKKVHSGAVSVYHREQWVAVCDTHFTKPEAVVACRETDPDMSFYKVVKGSAFGPTSQMPINITSIRCTGEEDRLSKCAISDKGTCPSGQYVSVICSIDPINDDTTATPDTLTAESDDDTNAIVIGVSVTVVSLVVMVVVILALYKLKLCTSCRVWTMFQRKRFTDEIELDASYNSKTGESTVNMHDILPKY